MKNYEHKKISIETLSYCIVSPRDKQAFYKGVDFQSTEIDGEKDGEKIGIIYPFYRYGTYESYEPQRAEPYVPGSSVKGALLKYQGDDKKKHRDNRVGNEVLTQQFVTEHSLPQSCSGAKNSPEMRSIMIDDFVVREGSKAIELKKLWKYQYLHEKKSAGKAINPEPPKQIKHQIFFPNVAFEMLKPNIQLSSDLYYNPGGVCMDEILERADRGTRERLKELKLYLTEIGRKVKDPKRCESNELQSKIDKQIAALDDLSETEGNLLSLGGYKGLIRALSVPKSADAEDRGALYIEESTSLPYGFIKLEIC